jgi:hypothetical protein
LISSDFVPVAELAVPCDAVAGDEVCRGAVAHPCVRFGSAGNWCDASQGSPCCRTRRRPSGRECPPRVHITQEIIDQAVPKDSGHCVIADAISAQVAQASNVSVDLQSVRWTDREKGVRYIYLTPASAQQLLLAFDYGAPIEPQTIRFGGAAQITEIKASSRATAARSKANRQQLEAKEAPGEEMTATERHRPCGAKSPPPSGRA